jgi:hypothetical protein
MRALSGAILTAVATVMLGVVAAAAGARYQDVPPGTSVRFGDTDTPLQIGLVAAVGGIFIGLGVAFVGLAHHHRRRNEELLRGFGYVPPPVSFRRAAPMTRVESPPVPVPAPTPAAPPPPKPRAARPNRKSNKKRRK